MGILGIAYILLCLLTGRTIVTVLYPAYRELGKRSYGGKTLDLPFFMVAFPVWYVTGTVAVTWLVYAAACFFQWRDPAERHPLTAANALVWGLAITANLIFGIRAVRKKGRGKQARSFRKAAAWLFGRRKWWLPEVILVTVLAFFFKKLEYGTFRIEDGILRVGMSIFSDFAVHLGMIRSFSFGNNFPTQYSHFVAGDIRYHFMYQFLIGNLEYLGMRIDHAMNISSILSVLGACMLIYVYAAKLFAGRMAGGLSVLFTVFHSSPSLPRFLSEIPEGEDVWTILKERDVFFAYTPKEDWGLWNLKVFANQRHLFFALIAVFLLLLLYTPYVYKMFGRLEKVKEKTMRPGKALLLDREVLFGEDMPKAVYCGLLLGLLAFWNGAMVIGVLCILFVMALLSTDRTEYLVMAMITVVLSMLQTKVFIHGNIVETQFYYGFIVENRTFWGVCMYLLDLSGVLLLLAAAYFCYEKWPGRWMMIAFSAPLLFAFHISLTPDVTVNHKYVMLSLILLSVAVAGMLKKIWERRGFMRRLAVVLLCTVLTMTGVYELHILRNIDEEAFEFDVDSKLTEWVKNNSSSKDIWLTDWLSIHDVVLGGTMLYYGWPYYAWSAGYDTGARDVSIAMLFSESDPERMRELMEQERIRFIMVDHDLRNNEEFEVREDVIASLYPVVYEAGEDDWRMAIYDTGYRNR